MDACLAPCVPRVVRIGTKEPALSQTKMLRRFWVVVPAILLASCGSGGGGHSNDCGGDDPIAAAVANLNEQSPEGLANAHTVLAGALACSNSAEYHSMAHFLISFVRVALFLDDNQVEGGSSLSELLDDMHVDLHGEFLLALLLGDNTVDPTGPELSPDFPHSARVQAFLSQDLANEMGLAAQELENISDDFSETLSGLFSLPGAEIDYGDCQLVASSMRTLQAVLYVQAVLDMNADIYRIDSRAQLWLEAPDINPLPFRIFCGDHPGDIVQDQWADNDREGFLNSAVCLDSLSTFDVSPEAQSLLASAQQAMLKAMDDFSRGMLYDDDDNSADDALYVGPDIQDAFNQASPWIDRLQEAIAGTQSFIPEGGFTYAGKYYALPSFKLDAALVFNPDTYAGRTFLPNYTGTPTVATVNSFDLLFTSDLPQLYWDLIGVQLSHQDVLEFWNYMNRGWDKLWVGWALEDNY